MKLPNLEYFKHSSAIEAIQLEEMATSVKLYVDGIRDDIEEKVANLKPEQYENQQDYNMHMDSISDELAQLEELEDTSKKLSVIGLYMVVEKFTKKIMKWLYHDLDEDKKSKKLRKLHIFDFLQEELNHLCNFDITAVEQFPMISELRILNNAIKHSGYVDELLASFPTWGDELDKEIDSGLIDLEKYSEAIPKYIHDFVERMSNSKPTPS